MQFFLALAAILAVSCSSHEIEKRQAKSSKDGGEKRVVCYYTNWSVYRKGLAKFSPQNINPYLCTHLVYAFGGLTDEFEVNAFDSYQDIEQGGYAQFNGLKQYNKGMKTLLALGGWNEGSARFSELVSFKDYRDNFTLSAIRHLRRYNFDGLDLDWEYPGSRDGSAPEDKQNYAILVKELREAFELEASKSSKSRLLLTMAVPAGQTYIDRGYDIPMLDRYLDFFNMLTYDYHSVYEPTVNHHAALFAPPGVSEYEVNYQLNVDWTVRYYLKKGASKDKLVVGIPTYGRSYTLLDGDFFTLGSSANGPGAKGNYTNEKGYLAFYEVCEVVAVDGWEVRMPYPKRVGPFAFKADQWVGYDDESVVEKKSEYVRDSGLGGIMFWTIDSDDFRGLCNGRQYPLIEAAKEALYRESPTAENEARSLISGGSTRINEISSRRKSPKTTTTAPEPSKRRRPGRRRPGSQSTGTIDPLNTPEPPTTPSSVKGFNCKREGFYPNPDDCRKYYWCLDSGASGLGIVAHGFTCPSDLIFNKKIDGCDHPDRVKCKIGNPNRGGAKATSTTTAIPRTTEFVHLQEDYDYYYDLNLDIDPVKPVPELTLIDEPLEANVITPTRNSGGSQFQLARETALEQPIPERAEVTTEAPSRNLGRERSRPQYSSIQRDRTRVVEEPAIREETEVVRQEPTADVRDEDSFVRPERPSSRPRRPQYVTLNRQRPEQDTLQVAEPREEFEPDVVETATQGHGGLNYVTLNRRRRPSTEPTILVEDKVTNAGLEYVTLFRSRPEATTEIVPDYDYLDVEPEATTTTTTSTTTTTTTTTKPPRIRIPQRFRNQNTRARERPSRPRPDGSIRRRQFRGRGRTTPEPEPSTEKPFITERPLEITPVASPVEASLVQAEPSVDTVAPVESVDEKVEFVVDPVETVTVVEPTVEKVDIVEEVEPEVNILKPTEKPEKTPLDSLIPFLNKPSSKPEISAFESLLPEGTTEEPFEQQIETEVPEIRSEAGGTLLDETFLLFQQDNQESQTDIPEEDSTGRPFIVAETESPSARKIETTTSLVEQPETAAIPVESPDPVVRTPLRTRIPDRNRFPPRNRTPPRSRDRILPHRRPSLRLRPGLQPTAVKIDGELEVKERVVEEATEPPTESLTEPPTEPPTESPVRPSFRRRPNLRPSGLSEESNIKVKKPKQLSEVLDITDVLLNEEKPRESRPTLPLRPRPVQRPTEQPLEERRSDLFEVSEDSLRKDSSASTSPPFSFIDIFSDDREIIQKSDINNRKESKLKLTPIGPEPDEERTTKITFPFHLRPKSTPAEEPSTSKASSIFDFFDTTTENSFTKIDVPEDTTPRRRVTKPITTTTPEPLTEPPTERVVNTRPRPRLTPRPVQQSSPTERPFSRSRLTPQPVQPSSPTERPSTRPRSKPPTTTTPSRPLSQRPSRPRPVPTERLSPLTPVEYDYVYDYYDGALKGPLGNLANLSSKALLHPDGRIECRDTGYFPHPHSCKKFISCSKTVRGFLRGWIYTCPQELVFDPVGGMCNWTETVDCSA